MVENIFQINEIMHEKRINKKRLSELSGYSQSSISDVLNGKTPLTDRFARIISNVLNGEKPTLISGDNHHIDIHHATVAEDREEYSPAINMIIDVIKEWPEPRRRKLAAQIVMMNGEEKTEEG